MYNTSKLAIGLAAALLIGSASIAQASDPGDYQGGALYGPMPGQIFGQGQGPSAYGNFGYGGRGAYAYAAPYGGAEHMPMRAGVPTARRPASMGLSSTGSSSRGGRLRRRCLSRSAQTKARGNGAEGKLRVAEKPATSGWDRPNLGKRPKGAGYAQSVHALTITDSLRIQRL